MKFGLLKLVTVAAAFAGAAGILLFDEGVLTGGESLVSAAQAVVGRPATPMSYAGVARRTTRRTVAVGTAAAVATPTCVQTVDAYGRVITRCY